MPRDSRVSACSAGLDVKEKIDASLAAGERVPHVLGRTSRLTRRLTAAGLSTTLTPRFWLAYHYREMAHAGVELSA